MVARAGAALRADGAARLSAVPQGRHRRRRSPRAGLAALHGQAGDGRRGLQRGVAHAGGRAAPGSTARATTRPRCTAPPTPACSATRRRCRSASAASSAAEPDGGARSCSANRACRRSSSTTRGSRLLRGATRARCCSPATTACRWCATTSPTRAAWSPYDDMLALPAPSTASTRVAELGEPALARRAPAAVRVRVRRARTSRSRTSAPTSIPRTSPSASSSRRQRRG